MNTKPDVWEVIAALRLVGGSYDDRYFPDRANEPWFETDVVPHRRVLLHSAVREVLQAYGLLFELHRNDSFWWFRVDAESFAPLPKKVNDEQAPL